MGNVRNNLKIFLTFFKKIMERGLYPVYFLSFFFPRDKNIWVFGSWFGDSFIDNPKYLFLYVNKIHKENIRAVWISKNRKIVNQLKKGGFESYYKYSLDGVYYCLKAKYYFYSQSVEDISFWFSGGATKVQLWHGIPLKKIGRDSKNLLFNTNSLKKILIIIISPWFFIKDNYVMCSSNSFLDIFSSAFGVKKNKIIVAGFPRNDTLFNGYADFNTVGETIFINKLKKIRQNSKIILYAPTFRDKSRGTNFSDDFDLERLDNFLVKNNYFFIIKQHIATAEKGEHKRFKRITFLPSSFDLYQILPRVNILVTDYSSIFFDILLLNKPVIFFPYDINTYTKRDREFYFDYESFVPGPIIYSFDNLLKCIRQTLNGKDKFASKRKKVRDFSFKHLDGKSSERIYNFILNYS